jgi:hypothetical protein
MYVILSSFYPHVARYFYNVFSKSRNTDDLVGIAAYTSLTPCQLSYAEIKTGW